MLDKSHFETIEFDGLRYPVVKLNKSSCLIDECPYCSIQHKHDFQGGCEPARCHEIMGFFPEIIIQGEIIPQLRGYSIKSY